MLKEKISKKKYILITFIAVLTLFRIWLGVKTPLFLQADAACDDFLLVRYAVNMLTGNWLGSFESMTLAKSASFPAVIALGYLCGIPYSAGLIVSYVFAVVLLCIALFRFIPDKRFAVLTYLFLLYSPAMLHEENTQKLYRGGYIIVFSLITIAAVIGIYTNIVQKEAALLKWSLCGAVSLPVFWFLKEDAVWILPFVLGGMACGAVRLFLSRKTAEHLRRRGFLLLFPLLILCAVTFLYRWNNYRYYGQFAVTDRQDTYFGKMLGALIKIEDENTGQVWINRKMLEKAMSASPTLASVRDDIEGGYEKGYWVNNDGEVDGDLIIWALRQDFMDAGIYEKGGKYVNQFYRDIYEELENAFETGDLKRAQGKLYISSITVGFTPNELISYYGTRLPGVLRMLAVYGENVTTAHPATGEYSNIMAMAELTNSRFTWPDAVNLLQSYDSAVVQMDTRITVLYQKAGIPLAIAGVVGCLLLLKKVIKELLHKKITADSSVLLILTGLSVTCAIVIFGVMWFCNFLPARKVYDYISVIIPIIEVIQAAGIYYLLRHFQAVFQRTKKI